MRRALKIAGWTVGALLLLVILLIGAVFVAGNTSSGRHLIENVTARLTDGHVRLQGLDGYFPSQLDLQRLEVSDERGVWLSADHIALRWSPMDLLVRHVQVDSLEVQKLSIARRPVTHPDDKDTTPSVPRADIAHLAVHTLDLGHELAGSDVSLVVTANAHLLSLQDASANVSAQRTGGLGHYELALKFDPVRMEATLKLQEPANGPLENILKVPGLGDLSVLATLSGPRSAEHVQLTLDAGSLRGRAQGTLDLPGKAAELAYSLNASAMTPAPGLAWNSISLQGNWHGPITTPNADGELKVEALQIPGGVSLGALAANLKATGGLLTAHAVLERLVIPGPNPQLLRDSPLTVDATVHMGDAARPVQLTATHRLFALRADATTAGKQTAKIDLRLPDLKPLAALGGQDVRGASTIIADLTHDTESTTLKADANSRIDGGKAAWVGIVKGPTRLQLSARVSEEFLTLDNLALAANTLSLTLNGTASREATQKLNARFALSLSDLRKLSPELAGNLKLTGKVDGPSNALSAAADLKTTLSVRGSPLGDLSASLNAEGLPHAPRGTVEAHGDLDGSPVRLNASLDQKGTNSSTATSGALAFHAVIHRADWKSVHADGDFSGSEDFKQYRGQLAFSVKQLSDLNRLLGTTLEGAVDGTASMRPEGSHSRAEFRLNAQDVSTGGVHANAQVAGSGPLDSLNLQLAAQSPAIAGKPASLTAVSVLNMTAHTLQVASADAKLYGQEIHLVMPTTASFGDGLALTATTLHADEAELRVEGRFSPTLDLRAAVKNVQPALINAFVPDLLAAGKIEGDADVKGSFTAPTGQIHLQALGMRSASEVANGLPAVDVHASADLMGDTALLNAKLCAGSKSQLTLDGHAPLAASGALDLKLAGTLDASLVNPLLEVRGRHVEGQLAIDTTVTGDTTSPKVGGTIRLAKGVFRDYTQGINLSDITAQIEGNEKALRIVNFTARAAPGTLTATGSANILEAGIPLDIKLTAKNAQPITNNIVTANVDADIHVSGKAREQLDINGTVHVNRADVGIPSGFPPNVAVLDVRRPGEKPPPQSEKPLIIRLDIRVQAPRQILVQGRGLDAELGGELRVRGTTDSPRVSGGFDLQRGTFDIASSRLTFSNGAVTFNGAGLKQKLDPTLDFTAQTQVSDATATVRITGFADAPKIELSSTPDLPQDEILARLLFGESAAQLTALQVVQIGSALATLSGSGGGGTLNPLAKIQKGLGLDRLSVGGGSSSGPPGTSSTGATIEAGRYVSSRVFVAVKESTTGTSQLAVDVDLTKHLKLQTRLGNGTATAQGTTPENDPGSSVGIAYQFEY